MKKIKNSPHSSAVEEAAALRQRAEEALQMQLIDMETISQNETQRVLHELRVHQIELEVQNEELRRAQVELEASRARYFDLYDLAPVGYFTLSRQGLILEANLTVANLMSVDRSKLVNNPLSRYILSEDADIYYQHRKKLIETGEPQVCELRMIRKDGTAFWARMEATAAQNAEGDPVYRTVLSEMTELKQAEETLLHSKEMLELANRELEQALAREQQLASTDGLTGLYNRRYFFELAAREFNAALRYQRRLAMLMFDMDGLKQINDTFGHAAGDRLLVMAAQTAAAQIRSVDVLARYGGDEFVVLLPQASAQKALPIAERIRTSIEAMRMETGKGPLGITLSIGMAEISHAPVDENVENVVQRADKALYTAKAEGRNRTVIYCEHMQERYP